MAKLKYEVVETVPRAIRVFRALRSVGYDFNAAVGDIVDNSISAAAKEIHVDFKRTGKGFSLVIRDNGKGMTKPELREAMRLGSDVSYDPESLGKFGMGLKTASLSQCRRLIVASNSGATAKGLSAFMWDLSHIDRVNRWELLDVQRSGIEHDPRIRPILRSSGTIVIWEDMDRLDEPLGAYQLPGSADNWGGQMIGELHIYLRMTFHRFMDGSLGARRTIKFFYNGRKLSPWDPFCRKEKNTSILKTSEFRPVETKSKSTVRIEPFVLPEKDGKQGFSSLPAWNEAKGLLPWNDSQGFYVYRENRLIHFGGWLRIRGKSEHTKYARVGVFFDSHLDDIFEISVHKMKLRLPASLAEHLKSATQEAVRIAKTRSEKRRPTDGGIHKHGIAVMAEALPDYAQKHSVKVSTTRNGTVVVKNKKGSFRANSVNEAASVRLNENIGITGGTVEDGKLWKLVCKPDGGFLVVLNVKHPFYRLAYNGGKPDRTKFLDSVFAAIGFTELRSRTQSNRALFNEIRDTISTLLADMAKSDTLKNGLTRGK